MEKKTFVQSTLHGNGKDVSTEQHSWSLARNRFHNPPGCHDVTVSDAESLSISSHFPIPSIHPAAIQEHVPERKDACFRQRYHGRAAPALGWLG